jgi:hypothetical protein
MQFKRQLYLINPSHKNVFVAENTAQLRQLILSQWFRNPICLDVEPAVQC